MKTLIKNVIVILTVPQAMKFIKKKKTTLIKSHRAEGDAERGVARE